MLQPFGSDASAATPTTVQVRLKTWRFGFSLAMPAFSDPACLQILDCANKNSAVNGLMQSLSPVMCPAKEVWQIYAGICTDLKDL